VNLSTEFVNFKKFSDSLVIVFFCMNRLYAYVIRFIYVM
jgi:hypothetical protein